MQLYLQMTINKSMRQFLNVPKQRLAVDEIEHLSASLLLNRKIGFDTFNKSALQFNVADNNLGVCFAFIFKSIVCSKESKSVCELSEAITHALCKIVA